MLEAAYYEQMYGGKYVWLLTEVINDSLFDRPGAQTAVRAAIVGAIGTVRSKGFSDDSQFARSFQRFNVSAVRATRLALCAVRCVSTGLRAGYSDI